jgi:hypothetical protein
VAELAGSLSRPVTAVKVLISDLLDAGVLVLPVSDSYASSAGETDERPTRQLLEALSVGLRKKWPDAISYLQTG